MNNGLVDLIKGSSGVKRISALILFVWFLLILYYYFFDSTLVTPPIILSLTLLLCVSAETQRRIRCLPDFTFRQEKSERHLKMIV